MKLSETKRRAAGGCARIVARITPAASRPRRLPGRRGGEQSSHSRGGCSRDRSLRGARRGQAGKVLGVDADQAAFRLQLRDHVSHVALAGRHESRTTLASALVNCDCCPMKASASDWRYPDGPVQRERRRANQQARRRGPNEPEVASSSTCATHPVGPRGFPKAAAQRRARECRPGPGAVRAAARCRECAPWRISRPPREARSA